MYAAHTSAGVPVAAFHYASTPRGLPPITAYLLIYELVDGEVQVISGSKPDRRTAEGKPPPRSLLPRTLQFAGVVWEVDSSHQPCRAGADLGDAYVTISAPNQAVFERIAASPQRVDR